MNVTNATNSVKGGMSERRRTLIGGKKKESRQSEKG
jgi:hypothetical protein